MFFFFLFFILNFLLKKNKNRSFTSAVGLITISSQLDLLFGMKITDSSGFYQEVYKVAINLKNTHLTTFYIGIASMTFLVIQLLIKRKYKWFGMIPFSFILVAVGITISYKLNLEGKGVSILGSVPSGFPSFSFPSFDFRVTSLIVPSFVFALIGYLEDISICTKFSTLNKYSIDPNQELLAVGCSNVIGTFFSSAIPSTGSFSRSTSNYLFLFFIFIYFFFIYFYFYFYNFFLKLFFI